jgi:hypothetical protein
MPPYRLNYGLDMEGIHEGFATETRQMTPHRLLGGRALACACVLVLASLTPVLAQFLPGPGQSPPPGQFPGGNDPAFPPPPGQRGPVAATPGAPPPGAGFPPPGGGGLTGPQAVCASFPPIRQAAEEGAAAIRKAGERKASREEVCGLFKNFVAREAKLVKFLADNRVACGVPPQAVTQSRANHGKTIAIAKQVCSGGGGPGGPVGPSLSDALGAPLVADDTAAKQPGRGTFDTLTGNVLSR